MKNFERFHAIEPEIEISQNIGKNRIVAPPAELHIPKWHNCYI